MGAPTVVPRDPALIKQIKVRDFDYFTDRQKSHYFEFDRLLSKSVLLLADQKWRDMRTILSPIYTSSKMNQMMYNHVQSADRVYGRLHEDLRKEN